MRAQRNISKNRFLSLMYRKINFKLNLPVYLLLLLSGAGGTADCCRKLKPACYYSRCVRRLRCQPRLASLPATYLRSRHYVTTPRTLNLRGLFTYTLLPCLLRETMSLASCSYMKRVEGGIRESCIG